MESGQTYHIFNHANGSENIFREEENYRFFLQQYGKYLNGLVHTYAYCLMPNHFHILVGIKDPSDLAGFQNLPGLSSTSNPSHPSHHPVIKGFSDFFNSYTKAFNRRFQRRGSLFVKHFKKIPILDEQQWQKTFLYIHLNPVKHGFVKNPGDWKWSSHILVIKIPKNNLVLKGAFTSIFFDDYRHCTEIMELKKEWLLNKKEE